LLLPKLPVYCLHKTRASRPAIATRRHTINQPLAPDRSLPLALHLLACLYSLLLLCLRGYVLNKSNEVRVEFRCKASANLAAPKAPTRLPAQEENKPTGHRRPPHQSTSCSDRSLPLALHLLACLYSLLLLSTSVATYETSTMR